MNFDIDLLDCPICHGPGLMEEEDGWCLFVSCLDCGCHTVEVVFDSDAEKAEAAKKAAYLWNMGKVISSAPGE